MKKQVLTLAFALAAAPVAAGPDRISILLGSQHFGADGFEEFNPGLFATWERGRGEWSVGAFRNSYGEGSVAFTYAHPLFDWDDGTLQAFAGAAYYDNAEEVTRLHVGDIVPLAGLQVRQGSVFAQFIPLDGEPVIGLLSFGVTFALD